MSHDAVWSSTLYQTTKILSLPKLKAFADDKLNVTQNIKVVFYRIENVVGKEENAGDQYFLLFLQCFQKAFSFSQKSSLCGKGLTFRELTKAKKFRPRSTCAVRAG